MKNKASTPANDKENMSFLNYLRRACCIFTPTLIVLYALADLTTGMFPSLLTVCLLFIASLVISLSSVLYKKMSFWAAHGLNFLILGAAFFGIAAISTNASKSTTDNPMMRAFAVFIVYVVIFAVSTVLYLCFRGKKKSAINELKPYESKFN